MKKVVITGATSFIGIHLIEEWIKEPCEIFAVVRPNSGNVYRLPKNDKVHIIEREMLEYDCLTGDITNADYFYHLAWEGARVPFRDDEEMQHKNYDCTLKAFDSAIKIGCSFFLGSGSQAEYGSANGLVDENYPCNPNTEYGKEKLHAYQTLATKAKEKGIRFVWTRIFSIYGKYDYSKTLIMSAIDKLRKNEPVEMTPCTQMWDYLNVKDAARAMKMFALSNCESGIYNVASGESRPLKVFVEIVKSATNSESELRFGSIKYADGEPVNLIPKIDKIQNSLGWKPKIKFCDGIQKLLIE